MEYTLIATATFGLEAVVKREVADLGYEIISVEDGKVTFKGDEFAIARCNLNLRASDRVLISLADFKALEFEDLFQAAAAIPWEEMVPEDGKVVVTGSSVKSKLSSVPACQRVVKKAISKRLQERYNKAWLDETGTEFTVKITILKDRAVLTLDTTGRGLNKRGYRVKETDAPMKETLAAALVLLSFWNKDRVLVDPCCGSGTIAIEAALIGRNVAPGIGRSYAAEEWDCIPAEVWKQERKRCYEQMTDAPLAIYAMDIDGKALAAAKANAEEAGVDDCISFAKQDAAVLAQNWAKIVCAANDFAGSAGTADTSAALGDSTGTAANATGITGTAAATAGGAIIITNPPYGERIGDKKSINKIYRGFREFLEEGADRSLFMITSDKKVDAFLARKADRRRKLYNGRIETCYYQFHGERPPRD